MNQFAASTSDLAGLDQEVRRLFQDFLQSKRLINRFVLSEYHHSERLAVNRNLLNGSLAGLKGMLSAQLVDILTVYKEEITRKDACNPGTRMFPTLREHMSQLMTFYTDVVDELFGALKADVMAGMESANMTPHYSHYSAHFKTWISDPVEWKSWPALTAAWDGVPWKYCCDEDQLCRTTSFNGLPFDTVIEGLKFV